MSGHYRLGSSVWLIFQLARRYHPDSGNPKSHELMANINAARTTILKAYDHSP
jgi:hypothetical protein